LDRSYSLVVQSVIALVAGILVVASLFCPWMAVGDGSAETFNAFQLGEHFADSLNLAFVSVAFDFLLIFGCFMIVGAVLRLLNVAVGLDLIYAGALLSLIATAIMIIVSGFIPFHTPLIGAWLCLCSSIAGLISPKLTVEERK